MAEPIKTELETRVRLWIKENKKENKCLEFKLKVDVSTPGAKAEFIRDVLALANSEGEDPREDGHLVIGFKDGRFHEKEKEYYDGATFSQILDSYIFPPLTYAYEEFIWPQGRRIGVLVVKPDSRALYVVQKKLQDNNGRVLLTPGQCLGRKADRKIDLNGEEIHARLQNILDSRIEEATQPLRTRIKKLEHETGPAFEVKKIRFEMEDTSDWASLDGYLQKLIPYAREFDHIVKHRVLDAIMDVTGRTRQGMPIDVAQAVDTVLTEVMPIKGGGFHHPTWAEISSDDKELFERVENAVFEMTWDACRYLRDIKIVEVGARLYWMLIRYATLNGLQRLQAESLHNARYCQHICTEERMGKTFPEGHQKLGKQIEDALNAFECEGYKVKLAFSKDLRPSDLVACIAILKTGDAVNWKSAKDELPRATALALAWKGERIVGLGAIKRERREYAAEIEGKSGVDFPSEALELGYVAVRPKHRGHHLSHCIVRTLLKQHTGPLFATTYSPQMKETLKRFGFVSKGKEWRGRKDMISLWEKA